MSEREQVLRLLDNIPDYQMGYVITCLQNIIYENDMPNETTLAAFKEGDKMISDGTGEKYRNTDELWAALEK